MEVGTKFASLEELEEAVKAYGERNYVQYYKRESRLVTAAKRKGIKRYINENLLVYQVHYHCIKGGRTFKSRSNGDRETRTFVDGCPANIKCCVSADGEHLEVTSAQTEHNHPISRALYEQLPKQRALPESVKDEVRELMKLKANKKLIKQKVQQDTGKVVLLKDLSNLASSLKPATRNDLQQTVELLQKGHGSDCHVLVNDGTFQGLMISTASMRSGMSAYPEFLGIDATYKLLDLRTPVYVIHNEDSNGSTEVVCVAILVREDECSLAWLLEKFKELNPSWTKTRCIMADKDLLERDVLKKSFPQAHVLICVFHTLKTFKREITCTKMNITGMQRDSALKLLQGMVYAASDEEFKRIEEELLSTAPPPVLDYYNRNWSNIKDEWYKGPQFLAGSFNNTTNNRLESINAKLKSVVPLYCSLEQFVPALFSILTTLQQERDHLAADSVYKRPAQLEPEQHLQQYQRSLTPYAFPFVKRQDKQSKSVDVRVDDQGQWRCQSRSGETITTADSCSCSFRLSMMLPCRHILAVRRREGLDLYDEPLYNQRWSRKYYHSKQRLFVEEGSNSPGMSVTPVSKRPRPMTQQQKYKAVFPLCKYLAELASEECNDRYLSRVRTLKMLIQEWEGGHCGAIEEHCSNNCGNESCQLQHGGTEECSAPTLDRDLSCPPFLEEHKNKTQVAPLDHPGTDNHLHCTSTVPTVTETASQLLLEMVSGPVPSTSTHTEEPPLNLPSPVATVTEDNYTSATKTKLQDIKMPKRIRPRGRPAGTNVTVIGFPRRKKVPKAFSSLSKEERQERMLGWLVGQKNARHALDQKLLLDEDMVETIPSRLPESILDSQADVEILREFFTKDGWSAVLHVVEVKKKIIKWKCNACKDLLGDAPSVVCEACLCWYHLCCQNIKKCALADDKPWFCKKCL